MYVEVTRDDLAADLWEYGEDELANRALSLSDLELARVGVLAGRILLSDEYATPSGASPMLGKACALAAVHLLDGKRDLARKRRRIRTPDDYSWLLPEDWEPPPEDEEPREVFLHACRSIAGAFEDRGFRFAKSGPHMSRRAPSFRFVVTFGWRYDDLEVALLVHSRVLGAWRRDNRTGTSHDVLAAGNLGNLRDEPEWLQWAFDRPGDRVSLTAEIVAALEENGLPFFAQFEDEKALVERLEEGSLRGCSSWSAIEWLLATGRRESALRHGRAVLAADARIRRAHGRELKRARDAERVYVESADDGLAFAAVTYGLEFL